MSFLRRAEVGLYAKMNFQVSQFEPDAAARGEAGWFGFLGQSQDAGVERPRRFLSIRRHCQLHVFDCVDFHFNPIFRDYLRLTALVSIFVYIVLCVKRRSKLEACAKGKYPM